MSPIRSEVEIARPSEEVFGYATDPARFSEWQHDVVGARVTRGAAGEVGARFSTDRRVGPGRRSITQEITEREEPIRWAARGVDGPVRPHVTLTIEPLEDDSRSRVTAELDFEGRGIGRLVVPLLVRPLAARRAPRSYQRLRQQLDGTAPVEQPPAVVRWTLRLEGASALDAPVRAVEPLARTAFGSGVRGYLLRGDWLGHAVHPLLTDVAVGSWLSAGFLDLLGGTRAEAAARRLVGAGVLVAAPTAWTGWAEWSTASVRDKRLGLVHAVTNGVAIGLYAASWLARRRHRGGGRRLAFAGATAAGAGAYLGGHLVAARKVGSHHPAYDETTQLRPT